MDPEPPPVAFRRCVRVRGAVRRSPVPVELPRPFAKFNINRVRMNIPSAGLAVPEGVDGNIHTNWLAHKRCDVCVCEKARLNSEQSTHSISSLQSIMRKRIPARATRGKTRRTMPTTRAPPPSSPREQPANLHPPSPFTPLWSLTCPRP